MTSLYPPHKNTNPAHLCITPLANLAAWNDFVGRAPWPAVAPLVDLLERRKSRIMGSGADEGVRPTALWDRRFRLSIRRSQRFCLLSLAD